MPDPTQTELETPKRPEAEADEVDTTTAPPDGPATVQEPTTAAIAESFSAYLLEASATGGSYEVRIIAEGRSKNGNNYPAGTLAASVAVFEGASVFAYELGKGLLDHLPAAAKSTVGDGAGLLRNLVGVIEGVAHKTRDGVAGLYGTLKIVAPWAQDVIGSVFAAGRRDLVGLSIDAKAKTISEADGATVVEIAPNPTVDLVSNPAAGGELLRLVASYNQDGDQTDMDEAQNDPTVDHVEESAAPVETTQATLTTLIDIREAVTRKVVGSGLPDSLQTRIAEGLRSQTFDTVAEAEAAADIEIDGFRVVLAELGPPKVEGFGDTREAVAGTDKMDRLQVALDGLVAGQSLNHNGEAVPAFRSIHEAYHEITGKIPGHTASIYDVMASSLGYVPEVADMSWGGRVAESAPGDGFRRVSEAVTSSTWAQMLGDSVTRRMTAEYKVDDLNTWRALASDIVSVKDFRTQRRVQLGGYGTLSSVAESANYPNLTSPTDAEETYSVTKYGGLESLTIETLANDDIGALRRIPRALGRAAALTVYRAAFDQLTTNALMGDGVALFAGGHANTNTTALSGAGLTTTRTAMMDQTAYGNASEVLGAGNAPRFILVPNELLDLATAITSGPKYVSAIADADTAAASLPQNTVITPIVVPFWTDATDWFAFADPKNTPTFEMAFLGGKETPDLTVADDPRSGGSAFTADKVSYRVRIVFGVKMLDHRGVYRQVVAG